MFPRHLVLVISKQVQTWTGRERDPSNLFSISQIDSPLFPFLGSVTSVSRGILRQPQGIHQIQRPPSPGARNLMIQTQALVSCPFPVTTPPPFPKSGNQMVSCAPVRGISSDRNSPAFANSPLPLSRLCAEWVAHKWSEHSSSATNQQPSRVPRTLSNGH